MTKITRQDLIDLKLQTERMKKDPQAQAVIRKKLQETAHYLKELDEKRKFPPGYFDQVVY